MTQYYTKWKRTSQHILVDQRVSSFFSSWYVHMFVWSFVLFATCAVRRAVMVVFRGNETWACISALFIGNLCRRFLRTAFVQPTNQATDWLVSWNWVLQKVIVGRTVKKFPVSYGTRWFIAGFTTACLNPVRTLRSCFIHMHIDIPTYTPWPLKGSSQTVFFLLI